MAQPASVATSPPNQAAAQTLIAVAHQAYTLYPKNCSGSVHYVITQLVDPNAPYLLANQLMQWLASPANGWRQVTLKATLIKYRRRHQPGLFAGHRAAGESRLAVC